jgi:hypothetical protein
MAGTRLGTSFKVTPRDREERDTPIFTAGWSEPREETKSIIETETDGTTSDITFGY